MKVGEIYSMTEPDLKVKYKELSKMLDAGTATYDDVSSLESIRDALNTFDRVRRTRIKYLTEPHE